MVIYGEREIARAISFLYYRFNGYDGRLDRQLEAVVMVMEALEGFQDKVQYDVVGHSGETYYIPFVDPKKPPTDDKLRLETIKVKDWARISHSYCNITGVCFLWQMMHAHSQYCWSGDHTLLATRHSVEALAKEDCDEAIVIMLSDANLSRYGIAPKKLSEALTCQEPKVQAYSIFIGSLGEEADRISQNMPTGRSFVCMDLSKLPQIMKQIFESSVLNQSAL